jgi:hypothetical protein
MLHPIPIPKNKIKATETNLNEVFFVIFPKEPVSKIIKAKQ